jgi:hypothetical protein
MIVKFVKLTSSLRRTHFCTGLTPDFCPEFQTLVNP